MGHLYYRYTLQGLKPIFGEGVERLRAIGIPPSMREDMLISLTPAEELVKNEGSEARDASFI